MGGEVWVLFQHYKNLVLILYSVELKFHDSFNSEEFNDRKEIALAAENTIAKYILFQLSNN